MKYAIIVTVAALFVMTVWAVCEFARIVEDLICEGEEKDK